MIIARSLIIATIIGAFATPMLAQQQVTASQNANRPAVTERDDSVSVYLIDVDLRSAIQALAPYVDRPVIFGSVNAGRVTLQSPHPIPRKDVVRVLRGLVESQGLELVADSASGAFRVSPRQTLPTPAAPPVSRAVESRAPSELYSLPLRHARAVQVAATVSALYGRATALGESSVMRGAGPTLSQQLNAQPSATNPLPVPA